MQTFDLCGHWRHAALPVLLAASAVSAQEAEQRRDSHHEVDEITVTATPLSRTVEQLAQPTSVLSGNDLATRQAASIGETLSGEVGVNSSYFGPVASRPVIRGQFGERVRILANGLDVLDASALSEDHQISLEGILAERVEIVRGPATLLYGSGAAGGLVNVVDRRIAQQPLAATVEGSLATSLSTAVGERAAAGRVAIGSDTLVAHADAFRRSTEDVDVPGFAESAILRAADADSIATDAPAVGRVENTDSTTRGGAIGLSWLPGSGGLLGAAVSTFDSDYGVPAQGGEEDGVRISIDQTRLDLQGEVDLGGPFRKLKLRAAGNDFRQLEIEDGAVATVFDTAGRDTRLELHHRPLQRLEGAFGLQHKEIDFDARGEEAYVPPSVTQRNSVFVFEELRLADSWALQGSARLEHQAIDTPVSSERYSGNAPGASIGSVWNFPQGFDVALNVSLTERHPNSTELYADGLHVAVQRVERGSVTQGNGLLEKERSTNVDLTLRGAINRVEWTVTGWINNANDYILLRPNGEFEEGRPVFEYLQRDVLLYGYEAEARIELLDTGVGHLHGRAFSDFVFGEEKDSGEYLPRLPPLRVGAGLHYTLDRIEASARLTWHRRQDKTAANELPTASYALLGAELSYALEEHGLFLFLRGSNLTDKDARQHSSPLKDTFPLPGRSLHVGVRYDF